MSYQLQSCTNLENLISKKEKVPLMAKNLCNIHIWFGELSIWPPRLLWLISDQIKFFFFSASPYFIQYLLFSYQIWHSHVWTTTTLAVLTLRRRVSSVRMRKKGKAGWRKERARCGAERDRDVNCHQHYDDPDDVDEDDLTLASITWARHDKF